MTTTTNKHTRERVSVIFEDDKEPLMASDLAAYLANFSLLYLHCYKSAPDIDLDSIISEPHIAWIYAERIIDKIPKEQDLVITFLPELSDLGKDSLEIAEIKYSSPLEIALAGCLPALVVALIISGGEITYSGKTGLRIKLPPLADGLRKLWNVFRTKD